MMVRQKLGMILENNKIGSKIEAENDGFFKVVS